MPRNILYKRKNSLRKFKLGDQSQPSFTTIAIFLFIVSILIIIWVTLYNQTRIFSQKSASCKSNGCNCCNMPRESNTQPQPEGWQCIDCPDGKAIAHPSHGWTNLDVKRIESKIKKYNIDFTDHDNFKCLFNSMKAKKLNSCMKESWPNIKHVPKQLCWRSWQYLRGGASVFEYTPCKYQSNFNILLPSKPSSMTPAAALGNFSKWWDNANTSSRTPDSANSYA